MSTRIASLRPLVVPLSLCVVHLVALRGLHAWGVTGRLLGAASPSIPLALVMLGFYVLRLVVFFVVPGWLVLAAVSVARRLRTQSR